MQHIETVTVGSGGAASITFSAIPADYTDLLIVYSLRGTESGEVNYLTFRLNGITGSISMRTLFGTGSSVGSETSAAGGVAYAGASATANTFGNGSFYLPNYLSNANKSFSLDSVSENNATAAQQRIAAGLWSNTAAVTSVGIFHSGSSVFAQDSSASLFGILAGSDGIVSVA